MNKLSFGLLSLLSTQPMTGYDLTLKINRFWRSTHSAIYPLLSELEEKGYIEFIFEKQVGKPDKKIYNLTFQGKQLLHDWFMSETGDEVIRDEITLKLFCIKFIDTEAAMKVLDEFEARYKRKVKEYTTNIENIKQKSSGHTEDAADSFFGSYILTQRALNKATLDLKWCQWVRKQYMEKGSRFWEENFNPENISGL
ncbi:MAG: putative transcriptional regulator [Eubacterium sp.]|nr:putative transcriptional regulator [Eubacterium sp.]